MYAYRYIAILGIISETMFYEHHVFLNNIVWCKMYIQCTYSVQIVYIQCTYSVQSAMYVPMYTVVYTYVSMYLW